MTRPYNPFGERLSLELVDRHTRYLYIKTKHGLDRLPIVTRSLFLGCRTSALGGKNGR
jgi:hypothetical protein